MFNAFRARFTCDRTARLRKEEAQLAPQLSGLREFFDEFGGCSFDGGLYRVVRPSELDVWQRRVALAFPEKANVICFGFDWGGSIFALDHSHQEGGEPGVTLLEPGTGRSLRIPANLFSFHNVELLEEADAALAPMFFAEWRAAGGAAPEQSQCVGYKKPLFLGGADEVHNLELSDLDVYWHVTGQLIAAARGLPTGARINRVTGK